MAQFLLDIVSPTRKAFSQQVTRVSVPTPDGIITVLAHHAPLFTALSEGEIKIVTEETEYYLAIGGGFMEVTREGASILVSRAVHAHELNEAEIEKAKKAAQDVISRQASETERAAAQATLRRSLVELKVLGKLRKRPLPYTPSAS